MTAPRPGDRVRIVGEAVYSFHLHLKNAHFVRHDDGTYSELAASVTVEVIKRPITVGDILHPTSDPYPGIGYVVRSVGEPLRVYHLGTQIFSMGHISLGAWPYLRGPYRVIDVPQDQS